MTTRRAELYRCDVCGIVCEVLEGGAGEMICCGQVMRNLTQRKEFKDRHIPVVVAEDDGVTVRVSREGQPHPMDDRHFIEWIEMLSPDGRVTRQYLQPGQAPCAHFHDAPHQVIIRGYCSVHGLWTAETPELHR